MDDNSPLPRNRFSDLVQKRDVVYPNATTTNMARSQIKTLLLAPLLATSLTACYAAEPGQEIAPVSACSLTFSTHESGKAPASLPAAGTLMCFGRTTMAAGQRNKSFTPSTSRVTRARPSRVVGVTLHDWEDTAIDSAGHVYIGDIGNNDSKRDALAVYEIEEPNPQAADVERISPKRV